MKQYNTQGIVLTRTDFGEADRIITFLTNSHGKVKAIAKGVRKSKAKLAGSVEPFGVSDLTIIKGRRDIDTLISARLLRNYGNVVKNLKRTELAYEFMSRLNRATEEATEPDYFELLDKTLHALNQEIQPEISQIWFDMQLLKLTGHTPNLKTDESRNKLEEKAKYSFDYDKMCFIKNPRGGFRVNEIKFLRLAQTAASPKVLSRVSNIPQKTLDQCITLVSSLTSLYFEPKGLVSTQ